jgi:hypothetical protein
MWLFAGWATPLGQNPEATRCPRDHVDRITAAYGFHQVDATGVFVIKQSNTTCALVTSGEWTELLTQFPEHTVFHTIPWLSAIAAANGLDIVLTSVFCAAQCLALWPCLVLRKGPLRILGSPLPGWSTAYLGPLFVRDSDANASLRLMLNHRAMKRSAYFACKVLDYHRDVDLSPFGFSPVLRYETYQLDLAPPESELWSNVRQECRKHIKKAQKQGVEIRQEQSSQFLDEYWELTIESFARSGMRPPHDRQLLDELWNRLFPIGKLFALSAYSEGQFAASIILVRDDHTMYNWGSASRSSLRHLCAPSALQWEAVRLARQLELRTYDFISTSGGAGKFKQSFGPHPVRTSTHWERSPSPILLAMKRKYENYLRRRQQLLTPQHIAEPVDAAD